MTFTLTSSRPDPLAADLKKAKNIKKTQEAKQQNSKKQQERRAKTRQKHLSTEKVECQALCMARKGVIEYIRPSKGENKEN